MPAEALATLDALERAWAARAKAGDRESKARDVCLRLGCTLGRVRAALDQLGNADHPVVPPSPE
jgi:hypothetical protein